MKAGKTEADPGVDPDGPGADPMALLESDMKVGIFDQIVFLIVFWSLMGWFRARRCGFDV